mmetsp:Transcript_35701/g.72764  ORF Transcript_35701/g.72764 Transcript_35701/m.72764 type:complete len:126 (-) Transcript_35701:285-662(-)
MEWQTALIILAAAFNFGVIPLTTFFTDKNFFRVDPLFDANGCFLVLLWGCAYLSTAWNYNNVPYIFLVFFVEKAFYVFHWAKWLTKKAQWSEKVEGNHRANTFFHVYGAGDAVFGIGFLIIFITS